MWFLCWFSWPWVVLYLHTCQIFEKNDSEQTTTISITVSSSLMFYKQNTPYSLSDWQGKVLCVCMRVSACVAASVCDRNLVFVISVWSVHGNAVVMGSWACGLMADMWGTEETVAIPHQGGLPLQPLFSSVLRSHFTVIHQLMAKHSRVVLAVSNLGFTLVENNSVCVSVCVFTIYIAIKVGHSFLPH